MKRIVVSLVSSSVFLLSSCANEPKEPEKEVIIQKETVVEKEKIMDKQPAPVIDSPKGTSITLDKKGIEVRSKKVDIKVQPEN